jgi:zinc transport system ATP-binding protein
MMAPLVTLDRASVDHNGQSLLRDISLTLSAGEIVTVIGPNGAGKSTLVKLATGLVRPSSGSVKRQPKLRIGYMPQKLSFDPSLPLTVQRFLTLSNPVRRQVDDAQARLNIGHLSTKTVHVLSGGELQRVLLARALLRQPQLLVLDEPVQGVDVNGQTELYGLITSLRQELGCGVLMVSHDLHLVMAQTDRVVCLNHHICCQGRPEKVSADPAYLQLFGRDAAEAIAVYTHRHDHSHNMHGDVVGGSAVGNTSCNHGPNDHSPGEHL